MRQIFSLSIRCLFQVTNHMTLGLSSVNWEIILLPSTPSLLPRGDLGPVAMWWGRGEGRVHLTLPPSFDPPCFMLPTCPWLVLLVICSPFTVKSQCCLFVYLVLRSAFCWSSEKQWDSWLVTSLGCLILAHILWHRYSPSWAHQSTPLVIFLYSSIPTYQGRKLLGHLPDTCRPWL